LPPTKPCAVWYNRALVSADGILLSGCSKLQLFVINLTRQAGSFYGELYLGIMSFFKKLYPKNAKSKLADRVTYF